MSGYTEDSILQQGLRKPTVGFIGKPFRPEALARKVREMLDRGGAHAGAARATSGAA
jgi:two-component system cell cycle sensor histidine kinase/response regulator CckA